MSIGHTYQGFHGTQKSSVLVLRKSCFPWCPHFLYFCPQWVRVLFRHVRHITPPLSWISSWLFWQVGGDTMGPWLQWHWLKDLLLFRFSTFSQHSALFGSLPAATSSCPGTGTCLGTDLRHAHCPRVLLKPLLVDKFSDIHVSFSPYQCRDVCKMFRYVCAEWTSRLSCVQQPISQRAHTLRNATHPSCFSTGCTGAFAASCFGRSLSFVTSTKECFQSTTFYSN